MKSEVTERLLYLNLNVGGWSRASTLIWMLRVDQGASLPRNLGRLKGFFYLNLELWRPRGFSTLILMKGNQGASLPRNLNCVDQRASLPWFLMKGNQWVSLPRNWIVVTKGLLYLDLWWKVTEGLLYLRTWIVVTNRLLYLDLWWKVTKGFLYLRTWDFACKRLKFWIRLFDGEHNCYFVVLSCVIFICSFLIWIFSFLTKKALINFCSPLKKILTLKFETWNLKLET